MLRRILLASAGAMALTGTALAADLPSRAPPPVYLPPPPIFTWTGLYLGINAGGTWSNNNNVNTVSFPTFAAPAFAPFSIHYANVSALGASGNVPVSNSGFIGGGQIGYNWQFANSFVAGIEADIQGVTGSGGSRRRANVVPLPTDGFFQPGEQVGTSISSSKRLDYLGTVRGRLGFLFTPTVLVYGTGGLAYGGVRTSTSIFQENNDIAFFPTTPHVDPFALSAGSFSNSRVGWTAGGGLEWLFAPNWSVKAEYLYYNLGTATHFLSPLVTTAVTLGAPVWSVVNPRSSTRFTGNIVRAGLNYHFFWTPPPIVAKY
jgi:outer membrane immunogenic protein